MELCVCITPEQLLNDGNAEAKRIIETKNGMEM
jgi:hypothetical protein